MQERVTNGHMIGGAACTVEEFGPGAWRSHRLEFGGVSYPYSVGHDCADRIVEELGGYDADKLFVLTDETVYRLHGHSLVAGLRRLKPVEVVRLPPGEGMKSMSVVTSTIESLIALGATRRSVVVALGGGVLGNLAGTVAGLLYRGVRLVHVPTTTIAAMDSVVSLKQAVNSSSGKNHIGLYHRPVAVYTDLAMLRTLPDAQLRSGLCEATKNCLAIRPTTIPTLRQLLRDSPLDSPELLLWLLEESLHAKRSVMHHDAREQAHGLVLEYGHTVGHAVELCDQRLRGVQGISHGEAVAFGMVVAARISARMGGLSPADVAVHEDLVSTLGAPLRLLTGISPADVLAVVRRDNKRGYLCLGDDEAAMVVLRSPGTPMGTPSCPLVPVPLDLVESVLLELADPPGGSRLDADGTDA